ncbi:helix-turn-helix domain-containing protein [Amycolatopsis rhabdoformis]|uniref:Helix-turn-helix domain-containing protein n=1 Tax=Amycolatopsis rhabdoformis TaxID=1448059 RepID=A0ABZ1ICG2_9PSEU|nr:helix-turn-helix domain-containing protein [Amycolatopsis rhabdoformis]WSE32120.1 helix-turn-helix domain-containing protein [Amycolatopsis rhabdoformis]
MGYEIDTRDGVARLRHARELFLTERRLPDDLPPWLSAAWRRSRFAGLDVTRDHVPAVPVPLETPLVRAATPVLAKLAGDLVGLGAAVVLSDGHARVVGCWADEEAVGAHLARIDTRLGADLSEPSTGTNGISHVLDTGGPFVLGGPEHLFELYQNTVCAGAPVTDPVTRKILGAVAVVCELDAPLRVLHAITTTATGAIERELVHATSAHEHRLLQAYLRAGPARNPIAVLDGRTRLVSAAAAGLLRPQDIDTLESYAIEAAREGALPTTELVFDDGVKVHLHPAVPGDSAGVLIVVDPPPPSAERRRARLSLFADAALSGSSPAWRSLERSVARVRTRPMLLLGEPGVGKADVARAVLGDPLVLDAADDDTWLAEVQEALAQPAVLLRHVERLHRSRAARLATLLAGEHPARVIATFTTGTGSVCADVLRTGWSPVEILVPGLRERTADIPELARRFGGVHLTQDAQTTLQRHDWPGNLAELKAVMASAAAEAAGPTVSARHLPGRLRSSAAHPRLTELEKAERQAISDALLTANGNRVQAATLLGIGRATLYRKMRRYGLD